MHIPLLAPTLLLLTLLTLVFTAPILTPPPDTDLEDMVPAACKPPPLEKRKKVSLTHACVGKAPGPVKRGEVICNGW